MVSRSISAILWTLVSVNVITLVAGGLITWLGYAIPVRLKQFGLLPELVIVAGLASLVVACVGLCALNYSSHLALKVYGISCAVFTLMLILGLPESWYKSDHFRAGNFSLDIIYFSLIFILFVLFMFAFTLAHYMRHKELTIGGGSGSCGLSYRRAGDCGGGGTESSSPFVCTCISPPSNADCHSQQRQLQPPAPSRRNRASMMIDKWFPTKATVRHHNHQPDEPASSSNNNNNSDHQHTSTDACRLSDLRPPLNFCHAFAQGNPSCELHGNDPAAAAATATAVCYCGSCGVSNFMPNAQGDPRMNSYAPLVHKGFYTRANSSLGRAESCSRQPSTNEELQQQSLPSQQQQQQHRRQQQTRGGMMQDNDCGGCSKKHGSSTGAAANQSCAGSHLANVRTRDDSSVQYGRQLQHHHHQQQHPLPPPMDDLVCTALSSHYQASLPPPMGRCRCDLSRAASLAARLNMNASSAAANNNDHQQLPNANANYHHLKANSYTMPKLSSASTYAIRTTGPSKAPAKVSRPKKGSSVVAMTAAAAAALLGGVTDTSSLARPPDTDDGMFSGAGADDTALMDNDRCEFDNNDNQLDVSMLSMSAAIKPSSSYHPPRACNQPVYDFATFGF